MNKIPRNTIKLALFITFLLLSIGKSSNLFATGKNTKYIPPVAQRDIEVISQEIVIDFKSLSEIEVEEKVSIWNRHNESLDEIEFWPSMNKNFRNHEVINQEDYSPLNSIQNELSKSIIISFNEPLIPNQNFTFIVYYYVDIILGESTENRQTYYHFQFSPEMTSFTHEYKINLGLPKTSSLHIDENIQQSYDPINGTVNFSGSTIYIYWTFYNITSPCDLIINVWFNEPPPPKNPIWPNIVGPLGGIILGALGVYWWMKRKEELVMKEVGKIFLTEDQKTLLNLIIESEGKITQKELIEKTGFSKSKISRNLTPLEHNELITKERWGREYRVFITDRGRKVIE